MVGKLIQACNLCLQETGSFLWSRGGEGGCAGEAAWLRDACGTPPRWGQQSCCIAGGEAECVNVFSICPQLMVIRALLPVVATEVMLISPVSDLKGPVELTASLPGICKKLVFIGSVCFYIS